MSVASANTSLMTLGAGWDNRSASGTPSPSGLIRKSSQSGTSASGVFDDTGNKRHWSFTVSFLSILILNSEKISHVM
jgi:hypothetical protein